jgi:glyceraldehyde 3-phosphate dehydrogenase
VPAESLRHDVKVRVNRFNHIGHLAIKAAFSSASGKVEIVAINDSFIDLNHMDYIFLYESTHGKFSSTVRT